MGYLRYKRGNDLHLSRPDPILAIDSNCFEDIKKKKKHFSLGNELCAHFEQFQQFPLLGF